MENTQPTGLTIADYEERAAEHRRLVRELDELLNGEAGAAAQASLADIVAQVRREGVLLPSNLTLLPRYDLSPYYDALDTKQAPDGEWISFAEVSALSQRFRLRPATAALRDVVAERRRQIEAKGYSTGHDDAHLNDDLAAYATYYAMPQAAREWPARETGYGNTFAEAIVPEGWPVPVTQDRRAELVKAAAMTLAAIEHLDRKETKEGAAA